MSSPYEFWRDYKKTTGELTWRLAVPDDLLAIRKLRIASERFLNQKQRNIPLFSSPILLTLVAEDETGKIVDALYIETQVEIAKIGCSEAGFTETAGLAEDLSMWLRAIGYKRANIKTVHALKEKMTGLLGALGFSCGDSEFSNWSRNL